MKKYSLLIQWSKEDQCYLGTCPEFKDLVNMGGPFVHGDSWEEVGREAAVALEGIIDLYEEENRILPESQFHKEE